MLVTLAIIGIAVGTLATALALAARARANRVVDDCRELLRHQATPTAGDVDMRALRDLSIVRYDALKEMAGQLSFSVALLNAAGDGIVLTSINGRTETRTYAKVVRAGRGTDSLSPEEAQAVRGARLGQGARRDNDVNGSTAVETAIGTRTAQAYQHVTERHTGPVATR